MTSVLKAETHDATNRCNSSPRQVAATNRLVWHVKIIVAATEFCRCDLLHKFKLVWIRATYRSDKLSASDLSQQQCRRGGLSPQFVASVCLGLKSFTTDVASFARTLLFIRFWADTARSHWAAEIGRTKTISTRWNTCLKLSLFGALVRNVCHKLMMFVWGTFLHTYLKPYDCLYLWILFGATVPRRLNCCRARVV